MEYKEFQNFLMEMTFQTAKLFGVVDNYKLDSFYRNLEINLLEDILKGKQELVVSSTTFKHSNNYVTPSVASALITSGISLDGTLPIKTYYNVPNRIKNTPELKEYATRRYNEIETSMITYDFMDRIKEFSSDCIKNNKVEMEKTLTAIFTVDDSYLGYIDSNLDDSVFPFIANLIEKEKDVLVRNGYKDTLCYIILEDMGDIKHFDIPTKNALINMASIDYDLLSGKKVTKERIENAKKAVDAAKAYNEETIEKYEDLFNDRLVVSVYVKKAPGGK